MNYTPQTIEQLNDTIAAERKRANDAWAAAQMEREVAEYWKKKAEALPQTSIEVHDTLIDAERYRWLKEHWDEVTGFTWRDPANALDGWVDEKRGAVPPAATAGSPE